MDTKMQKTKPSAEQLLYLEQSFNAIRDDVISDLGDRDAKHIHKIIRIQRSCEVSGRLLIMFGFNPIPWALGAVLLGLSKILETMEIGHNVMHGQYDWMNDPNINSKTYDWDTACPGESWKETHNHEHHTYTNILGKDRDYGYDLLRLTHKEKWHPANIFQVIYYGLLSVFFQWGVALHELNFGGILKGEVSLKEKIPFLKQLGRKGARQIFKDYIFFPLIAGPFFLQVLLGNIVANLIRNLWTSTIIFCGHFPEEVETFSIEECENETKGHWYYRQMLGSANFHGSTLLHTLSGNLSFQVEHHLFPDLPAHRYAEISPKVQAIAKELGIPYHTGSFFKQYSGVVKRILVHSLPEPKTA